VVIVYFDGYCNVCNRFVDFLIRRDRRRVMKYAALQGGTAAKNLPANYRDDLATMALQEGGMISSESTAAIKSIAYLGGIYSLMRVFLAVPRFVRDPVYRWVANHRYLFAGRRDTCRVPTPEERALFLD
jgi:predicted DCC family thiol-disulfide oxidoreductase YuxK